MSPVNPPICGPFSLPSGIHALRWFTALCTNCNCRLISSQVNTINIYHKSIRVSNKNSFQCLQNLRLHANLLHENIFVRYDFSRNFYALICRSLIQFTFLTSRFYRISMYPNVSIIKKILVGLRSTPVCVKE